MRNIDSQTGIPDDLVVFLTLVMLSLRLGGPEASDTKTHLTRANELHEQGAFSEAEAMYRRLLEEMRAHGERNPRYATALNGLGAVLYDQGRDDEVASILEQALPILEVSATSIELAVCRFRLGSTYQRLGRYREAEQLLGAAAVAIEEHYGPRHPQTASVLFEQGLILRNMARCVESEAILLRSFKIRQETLGKENFLTAAALASLGAAHACLGKYSEAEIALRRGAASLEKRQGPLLAAILLDLGQLYYLLGSFDQAESTIRRAAAVLQEIPRDVRLQGEVLAQQATLAWRQGNYDAAERLLREAVVLAESNFGKNDLRLVRILSVLGDVYVARREDQNADDAYQRSLRLIEFGLGSEHHAVAIVLVQLALLRQKQKRLDEARTLFERALEVDRKTIGPRHIVHGQHLFAFSTLLRKMKRNDEAKEAEASARAIAQDNRVNTFKVSTVDVRELQRQ